MTDCANINIKTYIPIYKLKLLIWWCESLAQCLYGSFRLKVSSVSSPTRMVSNPGGFYWVAFGQFSSQGLFIDFRFLHGRWRDVKLRAFENSKHRTYVDLKVRIHITPLLPVKSSISRPNWERPLRRWTHLRKNLVYLLRAVCLRAG